jgi:2,4-dienoyl-CoA reductase-like NADH-dependent reductase (Old Yellow Enzyme family)/thioredoxin reductase
MAPMGIGGDFASGCIAADGVEYYGARAKGGTGLLNIGFQLVTNKTDPMNATQYGVGTPLQEMGWAMLCDRVKSYGASVCIQLSCGLGRNAMIVPGMQNVSSSENTCFFDPSAVTRPLSIAEIHDIVEAYSVSSAAAKRAGADCVEIHGHVGYLIDQFMTPLWNKREDEYGGSFENRMRFSTEIYHAVRDAVGSDFPVLFRMVIDHKIPGGRGSEESAEMIRYLDKLGVDAFDVDLGCYDSYEWVFPTSYMADGCMADEAGAYTKKITDKPILTTGSYTPETALQAVEDEKTDFIVIGRGLLADPDFGNKLYYGKREAVRPCIKCNRFCLGSSGGVRGSSCSVNMENMAEKMYAITKTEDPKQIVVVGAGPGGLEAARVAAEKGHNVTLYEKDDDIGGQLVAAAVPVFKDRLRALIEYYRVELARLGVEIVYNKEITADSPELTGAWKIIVAIGASGFVPPIKGSDHPKVLEVIDAHLGDQSRIGQKVVVAGGGPSGCDCAIDLAMSGKEVTIVEMLDELYPTATLDNKVSVLRRIAEEQIDVRTAHKVLEFTDDGVRVENKNGVEELAADTVIVAMGTRPRATAAKSILDRYVVATKIGDCSGIGQVGEAVREGFLAAWAVE